MRYKCSRCKFLYSDNTKGQDCINKYCFNKNICESCSDVLGLSYSIRECNNCIINGQPNWFQSWMNFFTRLY